MPDTSAQRLRIDIAVHGRFHAFHLARALISRGHDVRVLTNYPGWAATRFGIPRDLVRSLVSHGIATRILGRTLGRWGIALGQPSVHKIFGAWVARHIRPDCDLVYIFSGVAEETLARFKGCSGPRVWLVRGSSHIRTQHELLAAEEVRAGVALEKPSAWSIAREEREYALARRIVTLSTFSFESFRQRPGLADKAMLLLSAVDASRFKPKAATIEARAGRIERGNKLRVLIVGAFSFRKGGLDILEAARALCDRMSFRFVGDMPAETLALQKQCGGVIELVQRVPEFDLVAHYAWADVFLFPTIEDGFPAVVAQAQASGLPVITTPNGSGPDLVASGKDGLLIPIRSPQAIIDALRAWDSDRPELAQMARASGTALRPRDWSAMAADLEGHFRRETRGEAQ